ncbi:MAG: molybdopterin molybdotransferase MoeA [Verrucomicrobia bacterium]|nr:molybdopterin molybdotransferase MoeA [Verrucomicrobiota bacterium]
MLELEEAVENILSQIEPLPPETVSLSNAHGRYSAQPFVSGVDLPPFDNSAMDGYAVLASDVVAPTSDHPVLLRLTGKVAAGETFAGTITPGTCVRIFTGSPLPPGADAVVMQEDTRVDTNDTDKIWITDSVKPLENVRFRGEDVRAGMPILQAGERLTGPVCGLLGATGIAFASVFRQPIVGLLATGSELVEPGQPLRPGQIYESNRVGLSGFIQNCGAIPKVYPLIEDTLDATVSAMEKAFSECDAVVTSGGVSVGEFDFVKAAFERLGGELSFWKVAIKPGKPFVFGRLNNKFLFGVPGNPVSALVTFFLLARPALLRLQGAVKVRPLSHPAILTMPIHNKGDRRHFVRVAVDEEANAHPTGIQASHILSSLAKADGLVDVPPRTEFRQGSAVRVIRWDQ